VTSNRACIALSQPRFDWLLVTLPLAGTAALLALEATDLDRIVQSWFFDPLTGGFPLRYNTFLEVVLHYWTKYVVALIAGLAIAGFLLSFTVAALRPHRRLLLFVSASIALSTAAVTSLKLVSGKHCPWDLEQYGGLLPYTKLLEPAPPAAASGHCFPAGHASTGFSLLAFYFAGRARCSPRLARAGLILGLSAGLVLGFGRMLQGAHFLTHVLWSGVVCWLVILLLYVTFYGQEPHGS
jgi:membrane-associated PAP2 superfamily phosphatase